MLRAVLQMFTHGIVPLPQTVSVNKNSVHMSQAIRTAITCTWPNRTFAGDWNHGELRRNER